jgi:RimJ/RimL family protein N-acetyltransferase
MTNPGELRTERLLLRQWLPSDAEPFARLNADPLVMKHFPSTLSREESDATIGRINTHVQLYGFGLWAVEVPDVAPFIGFVGLIVPRFETHFTPCVEIGWRLAAEFWNYGYATEGAQAALRFAFEVLRLEEIVAITIPANTASRRVMEKIGMTYNPEDDFDHPFLLNDERMRRHVLYRVRNNLVKDGVFNKPPERRL